MILHWEFPVVRWLNEKNHTANTQWNFLSLAKNISPPATSSTSNDIFWIWVLTIETDVRIEINIVLFYYNLTREKDVDFFYLREKS